MNLRPCHLLTCGTVILLMVVSLIYGDDSASVSPSQSASGVIFADTSLVNASETGVLNPDSSRILIKDQHNWIERLVFPLAATALAGAVLLLLFTQRGR